ncbi:hypothetical protein OC846_003965 [Tilletia horrida]|uniref:Uncharacterized protein n=1 Tax=Tilletia horrida TaxID=155126 RepID=A0AAN6GNL9_9BASI|nr:hypothetical protein OC845_004010 [Tilletia horrida]KAK0549660.1 hypothetical protein OC846_003965 [Tilletia horrida]KAK0564804.1 hypothetical protein OC861_004100 [Tilletia horrida]
MVQAEPASKAATLSRDNIVPHSSTPSLLTGLDISTKPSINAAQIAAALRARLEFASLKAANGLALHSLDQIEKATLEAERMEALMLEQHANFLLSQEQKQHASSTVTPTTTRMTATPRLLDSSPSVSSTISPNSTAAAGSSIWASPTAAIYAAAKQGPQQSHQLDTDVSPQPRTIFDALAARSSTTQTGRTLKQNLLFPQVPSSLRSSRQSPSVMSTASTSSAPCSVISATTLLHRAASIPQLGSPRRLIDPRVGLSDPHNDPTEATKAEEHRLVVQFESEERQKQALARQQAAAQEQLLTSGPSNKRSSRGWEAQPPTPKRARFSQETLVSQVGHSSMGGQSAVGRSPSKAYSNAAAAFLSARSPSSKLASSYARGVAASSAIGTGLARSPDPRLVQSSNSHLTPSSLAFQSPRGLTLGQGLGITSRHSLTSGGLGTPLGSRKREESFERGAIVPQAPNGHIPEATQSHEGGHAFIMGGKVPKAISSTTPVQRSRPLLSPPPSSPAHRQDGKMQTASGNVTPRRAPEEFLRKTYMMKSPNPALVSTRSRPGSPMASASRHGAPSALVARSPVGLTSASRSNAVDTVAGRMAAPSSATAAGRSGSGSQQTRNASQQPAQQKTQPDFPQQERQRPQENFGLGFLLEHGEPMQTAPLSHPGPATPKTRPTRRGLDAVDGMELDGTHERGHFAQGDNVDMEGSEAAQLMLFLAGSPSAPPSSRFAAGVTPSVTNGPFTASTTTISGEKAGGRSQASKSASERSGMMTAMGVGPGSGSPGPEGKMVARMLTYGSGTHLREKQRTASLSPRLGSANRTPTLDSAPLNSLSSVASGPAATAADGTASSASSTGSNLSVSSSSRPTLDRRSTDRTTNTSGKSRETTPEPQKLGSGPAGTDSGAQTPPPHTKSLSIPRPATPPRHPPCTPKAPGSSTFSYAEFLNVSPSPQPRLRRTPRIGVGKNMSRTGSGDRTQQHHADLTRTPSRMSRGRFLDFDQELGLHSATMEQRKRFAQMLQIGEEEDAEADNHRANGRSSGANQGEILIPGSVEAIVSDQPDADSAPQQNISRADSISAALKEKSHNQGAFSAGSEPREPGFSPDRVTSTDAVANTRTTGLASSPLLKPQVAAAPVNASTTPVVEVTVVDSADEIVSATAIIPQRG